MRRRTPEIVRMCLPHIDAASATIRGGITCSFTPSCPRGSSSSWTTESIPTFAAASGYTILHHLASGLTASIRRTESRIVRATMLLDAGASLTIRDSLLKSTPLGWACRWGRIELVRLYLERGADPVEADAEPWATPLAWATKRGHHEIIELLRSHGAT